MRRSRIVLVVFSLFLLAMLALPLMALAEEAEWKPLCNGKDLTGWHAVGDGQWTVEDGAFVGRANNERLYGLLVSDDTYGDCTVRFKFKCLSGDSGFYIRTMIEPPEKAHGLQVQVGRTGSGTGGVYESYGRAWIDKPSAELDKTLTNDDQWNEMVIVADGGDVTITVNGIQSAQLKNDPSRREGHFALQMHSGCVMHVMFKDLEILEK